MKPTLHLPNTSGKFKFVKPTCLCLYRVWRRRWSSFRRLWARQHVQMKPSVASSLKGVSLSEHWRVFYENVSHMGFKNEIYLPFHQPGPNEAETASPAPTYRWGGHWPQHDLWCHYPRWCDQETRAGPIQEDAPWPSFVRYMWLFVGVSLHVQICRCQNMFLYRHFYSLFKINTVVCFIFQVINVQTQWESFVFTQSRFEIVINLVNYLYKVYLLLTDFVPQARDEDGSMDPFLRNSFLFRKKTFGSMLDPQRKPGVVCTTQPSAACHVLIRPLSFYWSNVWTCFSFQVRTGYDGLGGRTKFFQPVSFIWVIC